MEKSRKLKNFRLSSGGIKLLEKASEKSGVTQTAALEMSIRNWAAGMNLYLDSNTSEVHEIAPTFSATATSNWAGTTSTYTSDSLPSGESVPSVLRATALTTTKTSTVHKRRK